MSSEVARASAREVFEAYHQALINQDWASVRFWRPVLIERLELISGTSTDSERPAPGNRAGS